MIKREFKINLKSFLIWCIITIGLYLLVYLMYPSIMNNENIKLMDEYVKMFPEEMIKAVNLDIASMKTVYGWLKSEGFIFIVLIIGVYSSILGINIISKEEKDKTIEYLNSLPIKRSTIVSNKLLISIIYILLMISLIAIFNYISLSISGKFDKVEFILLSITPILCSLPLFSLNLFLSTFIKKKSISISLGIVFISYFIHIISGISEHSEFLKYFTIYTLSDVRNVIINNSINPILIIISILISLLFIIGTYVRYESKELV